MSDVCPTCYRELPPGMDLTVSLEENTVIWKGICAQLRPIETEILHVLASAPAGGWVVREQIYAKVYGAGEYPLSDTFKIHLVRLRRKMRDADIPVTIESSWYRGAGGHKWRLKYGY